jgi:hypothetical protein
MSTQPEFIYTTHKDFQPRLEEITSLVMMAMKFLNDQYQEQRFKKYFTDTQDNALFLMQLKGEIIAALSFRPIIHEIPRWVTKLAQGVGSDYFQKGFMASFIAVHDDHKKQGLSKILLTKAVTQLNPTFITAETKNPVAVQTNTSTLSPLGYKSFYNLINVTEDNASSHDKKLANLLKATAISLIRFPKHIPTEPLIMPPSRLPTNIPDTHGFSPQIIKAFRPVVMAQTKLGNKKSAAGVLIQLKN